MAELARAKQIDVTAYTLHGPICAALESAARRGARVTVELEAQPYHSPGLARENERIVRNFSSAGIDARLDHPVHAKTILADGNLYLDDKNWHSDDLVLRDDDPSDRDSIATIKHVALAQEAALLRGADATSDAIVESESFGGHNAVYSALQALARAGLKPRVLVAQNDLHKNARERDALECLKSEGARVRVCKDSEKIAVAGDGAWIGSANATIAFDGADLPDWGVRTWDPTIVTAIRDRIEAQWKTGRELAA